MNQENKLVWYKYRQTLSRSPDEVRKKFESFKFENLSIKSMHILGLTWIDQYGGPGSVDSTLNDMLNETNSDDDWIIHRWTTDSDKLRTRTIARCLYVDYPFIIQFKDGATFEVFAVGDSGYALARDKFGADFKGIHKDTRGIYDQINANLFFNNCIGHTVRNLDFKTIREKPDYYGSEGKNLDEYIQEFALCLDNGTRLWFGNWVDYFMIRTTEPDGTESTISVPDVARSIVSL